MSKHTPGPWFASRAELWPWPWHVTDADGSDRITTIDPWTFGSADKTPEDTYSREGNEHTEANARLIAAAPELLDALRGLLDQVDRPSIAHLAALKELRAAVRAADDAVAKAEAR